MLQSILFVCAERRVEQPLSFSSKYSPQVSSDQKENRSQVSGNKQTGYCNWGFLISHFYAVPYSGMTLFCETYWETVLLISPINTVLILLWWFSGPPYWLAVIRLARVSSRECYTRAPGVDFLWMRPLSLKCWNLSAMPPLRWASGTSGWGQTGHFFPPGRALTSSWASPTPTTWCDEKLQVSPLALQFEFLVCPSCVFLRDPVRIWPVSLRMSSVSGHVMWAL